MALRFSKKKMIERVTAEGRTDMITEEVIRIMDNLDGQEVNTTCWRRTVYDEPVYWVYGKDGEGNYVNEADCEYA